MNVYLHRPNYRGGAHLPPLVSILLLSLFAMPSLYAQLYDIRTLSPADQLVFQQESVSVRSANLLGNDVFARQATGPGGNWAAIKDGKEISESEFFALMGDEEKSSTAKSYARNRISQQTAGYIVGAAGLAGLISYLALSRSEFFADSPKRVILPLLSGPILLTGEMFILSSGTPKRYPRETADEAAGKYNQALYDRLSLSEKHDSAEDSAPASNENTK